MTIRRWMVLVVIMALVSFGIVKVIALRRLREEQAMIARAEALRAQNRAIYNLKLTLLRHRADAERHTLERSKAKEPVSRESPSPP
jgi:hypothetical protein